MEIEALRPFSEKGVNLKKIGSRPVKNRPWEYVFFFDFEGYAADAPTREVIE